MSYMNKCDCEFVRDRKLGAKTFMHLPPHVPVVFLYGLNCDQSQRAHDVGTTFKFN